MAKMGRPPAQIDKKQFESLCGLQCTHEEVCDFFNVTPATLEGWCKNNYKDENGKGMTFYKVFQQKRGNGKISLRRMQWKLAEKNATMAIFLGKQYLGQTDVVEVQSDEMLNKAREILQGVNSVIN